jgi:hypothetical protein
MNNLSHARRAGLIGLALAATVAVTSCSSVGSESSGITGGDAATSMVGAAPDAMPAIAKAVDAQLQPQIVRSASLSLTANDVASGVASIKALIARLNGTVTNEDTQMSQDEAQSTISGQVPAASLDSFIAAASTAGDVRSISTSAYDVTSQSVDLDARIASLTSSIDRLRQLMSSAANVGDLLAAEGQLASRQADLDSLTSQRAYLSQQVTMSSVSVTITQPKADNVALPITAAAVAVLFLMGVTGVVVGLVVSRTYRRRQRSSSPTA